MGDPCAIGRWGWTRPARLLLAVLVGLVGAGLVMEGSRTDAPEIEGVPALVVDPNTAPPEVLLALPRIGPTLVARIVAERDEAPFDSLMDLSLRVRGIGPVTISALEPFLRIEAPNDPAEPGRLAPVVATTTETAAASIEGPK